MNVLGVDPSLRATGVALSMPGVLSLTTIKSPPEALLGAAGGAEVTRARVRYITGRILRMLPDGEVLTVIETPYVPHHHAGAVIERAWLYGFLVDQLMQRGPVVTVSAPTRAKYAAKRGNADKKAVLAAMRAAVPGIEIGDHNEADALALVCMGARYLGLSIDGLIGEKQEEAMASVLWPKRGSRT